MKAATAMVLTTVIAGQSCIPHQRGSLNYKYTDTSEGGSDWFNDYIENDVELIPIEERDEEA